MIAARQNHLAIHGALCVEHRAAKVAAANAKLDGHVTLLLFPIDERGARYQAYRRHIRKGHLNHAVARGRRRSDRDVADRIQVLAVGQTQAHHHRKMPIAGPLVKISCALAADRRLDHRIHISRSESVARRARPIDIDANGRLPQ